MEIFYNILSIFTVIKNQFKVSLLYKSYIFNCLIKLLNGSVSWYTFYIKKNMHISVHWKWLSLDNLVIPHFLFQFVQSV